MKFNTFSISKVITTILVLCLMSPIVYARTDKLAEPAPVTLNCNLTDRQMKTGIRNGGSIRGWAVVRETPWNTELKYVKGNYKHSITVNVNYTSNTFAITYIDSTNLNYKVKNNGVRYIHPKPIGWMMNLSGDLQTTINNQCFE